ncbi:MAG: class I SAM-dependent methyltransferase [Dehalococcoidales bacterium]|jgi:2-polyprenyl-3-methyl-5-hydroxy-6-metoxy-1,4-benzoquinol methylase|nr:class I SAM-dependent methyltransferase [Dehalococcoidales bacterium]MDD3994953.1 class I SAM-dependent methyltransferase [Dehalococcoidales bacterium]NLT28540.1 class I SAM-dependent methyltransferase [Dehalococcoidales bacterium]
MDTHDESEASPFLVENISLLPKGKALDIAMGNGRNTIYLAEMGFDAEGVDVSEEAVKNALERAKSAGVNINAYVKDIEAGNYIIEKNAYDVIVCFNYLHRPLMPRIKDGLKKGGMVVYQTYTIDQLQFGKPSNPDFLLKYNELLEVFSDFRCLRYYEGITDSRKAVAGIIAQKI